MKRLVLLVTLVAAIAPSAVPASTPASDSVTGLPLYPNAGQPDNTLDVPICGHKGRVNTYDLLPGKDAAAVAWFSAHLHGFTHTRGIAIGHTQDQFIKTDGSLMATVTGNRDGSLYGVSYMRVTPPLNPAQQAALGKRMTSC
jgi:hypothetical protein